MRRLVVTEGDRSGEAFEIEDAVVLGREGTDILLDDPELSRRHASLRPAEDGIEIEDLGSTNGTFVNGRRIDAPTRLHARDSVRVGHTVLTVEIEGLAGATVMSAGLTVMAPAGAQPTAPAAVPPSVRTPTAPASPAPATPLAPPGPVLAAPPAAAFSAPSPRRRAAATRLYLPALLTLGTILAVGVALVVYFATR